MNVWAVYDSRRDRLLGQWRTLEDAEIHAAEHQAMDPEAELEVYELDGDPGRGGDSRAAGLQGDVRADQAAA